MDESIHQSLKKVLPLLKEKFGVTKIAVFGSSVRDALTHESDVDLVIEFEHPIGLKFIELNDYLQEYLHRKVDILTPDGLKSIRSERIKKSIKDSLTYV